MKPGSEAGKGAESLVHLSRNPQNELLVAVPNSSYREVEFVPKENADGTAPVITSKQGISITTLKIFFFLLGT